VPARTAIRWLAAVLLVLYAYVIARLTLAPPQSAAGAFSLLDRVADRVSGGRLDWSQTEVLGNVALFMPAGFLAAIVVGRAWVGVALCVMASAGIELAQLAYLPSRVPSLADVEHNSLGGLIGAICAWPVARWVRFRKRHWSLGRGGGSPGGHAVARPDDGGHHRQNAEYDEGERIAAQPFGDRGPGQWG